MPRDDTFIHYSSRTFIYRSYFEHFESTNELFFHQVHHKSQKKSAKALSKQRTERSEREEKEDEQNYYYDY